MNDKNDVEKQTHIDMPMWPVTVIHTVLIYFRGRSSTDLAGGGTWYRFSVLPSTLSSSSAWTSSLTTTGSSFGDSTRKTWNILLNSLHAGQCFMLLPSAEVFQN